MRKLGTTSAVLAVAVYFGIGSLHAGAVRDLAEFKVNQLAANDDGSTGSINLGFNINLFGVSTSQIFINNNGNVTFGSSMSTFTPSSFGTLGREIIAPFWADVDTRNAQSGLVTFGNATIAGRDAFGVNWVDVGYYNGHADKINSFQLVLINRDDTCGGIAGCGNFNIEMNYDRALWETGDASGGSGGLGGSSARAGFTNGQGTTYEFPGSAINGAFLDGGSNSLIAGAQAPLGTPAVLGRYVFEVRNSSVGIPGSSPQIPDLPDRTEPDPNVPGGIIYIFDNVPPRQRFDPPGTYGFDYIMNTPGSFFTQFGLPAGFADPFQICYFVGAVCQSLGSFTGDGSTLYSLPANVMQFRVTGINPTVNSDDPSAFPIYLDWNGTAQASFSMVPLFNPSAVPEPGTITLVAVSLGLAAVVARRRVVA